MALENGIKFEKNCPAVQGSIGLLFPAGWGTETKHGPRQNILHHIFVTIGFTSTCSSLKTKSLQDANFMVAPVVVITTTSGAKSFLFIRNSVRYSRSTTSISSNSQKQTIWIPIHNCEMPLQFCLCSLL